MKEEDLHKGLINKLYLEHAFWSYEKPSASQISDEILIEKVLLLLDIDDIMILFSLYPKSKIKKVWKETLLGQEPMYHSLNRLYSFMFFDIKNPDRYIKSFVTKRYNERFNRKHK